MTIRSRPPVKTIMELLRHLGDIPPERVRFDPVPGTAVIDDLMKPGNAGCELVDGTLVEKAVGWLESFVGSWLLTKINDYVLDHDLGAVSGEQGMIELPEGLVRGPDVAFFPWAAVPDECLSPSPPAFPRIVPALVVEVVSPSNTAREMARKRGEYFRAGTKLVWEVDPAARTARVYTAEDRYRDLTAADAFDGGDVLPGLTIPVAAMFARMDRRKT